MDEVFDASYVTLHVRVSNKTAFHLYRKTLGYECVHSNYCNLQPHSTVALLQVSLVVRLCGVALCTAALNSSHA
jgi:hypothetical protein